MASTRASAGRTARRSRKVPDRGDIVWLDFDPQAGHEQAGRRPALVLSPATYNARTGLALCCPITTRAKGYPFEVALPGGLPVTGVILADQVNCMDWRARRANYAGRLPTAELAQVLTKLYTLLR